MGDGPFHEGELRVQRAAGVEKMAADVGLSIRNALPAAAAAFLSRREFVVVAAADAAGQVWASLLAGEPGFARAVDPRTVALDARLAAGDPLDGAFAADRATPAGLLAIELATRRRIRVNGDARRPGAGGRLEFHVRQAYGNCPKYIQSRALDASSDPPDPAAARVVRTDVSLGPEWRAWVRAADTFFIASLHPTAGADASHRGGAPGFVRIDDDGRRLRFPDYAGNAMFNTLGNLAVNPAAGLLFPDFGTGATLQLTGRARVLHDPADWQDLPGAERAVELTIGRAVETRGVLRHRYGAPVPSPFNPSVQ